MARVITEDRCVRLIDVTYSVSDTLEEGDHFTLCHDDVLLMRLPHGHEWFLADAGTYRIVKIEGNHIRVSSNRDDQHYYVHPQCL